MLKQKRFWISIFCMLVIVMGCGLFYGHKVALQEPVKVYKVVEVEHPAPLKPPPPGETAESGHWHGDQWHVQPHAPLRAEDGGVPVAPPLSASTTYIPLEPISDLEEYLRTQPSEVIHGRVRDNYINKHREQYPDCTEHEAVMADALRDADFYLAELEYRKKYWALVDESKQLSAEYDEFSKYQVPIDELKKMSRSERLNAMERIKALMEKKKAHRERWDALQEEKPSSPNRRHTH